MAPDKNSWQIVGTDINSDAIRPIYLVTGEEAFLVDHCLRNLRRAIFPQGDNTPDYMLYDFTDQARPNLDIAQLAQDASVPPFMAPRRLIIIKRSGVWSGAGRTEELLNLIESLDDLSAVVIFSEEKVDRRQRKLMTALENKGRLVDCKRQSAAELRSWVSQYGKHLGLQIDNSAAYSLIDRFETDMMGLSNELRKLALQAESSGQKQVTLSLLDEFSVPDLRGNIFNLTDALAARDTRTAVQLVEKLYQQKEPVLRMLFMLGRHFSQLLCASEASSAQALIQRIKVHPFVAQRLIRQVARLSVDRLVELYDLCYRTDVAIKSGAMEEQIAFDTLVVQACM